MKKLYTILGWTLMIAAFVISAYVKIDGLHMTQGEQFINYWQYWLAAISLALTGYVFIDSGEDKKQ